MSHLSPARRRPLQATPVVLAAVLLAGCGGTSAAPAADSSTAAKPLATVRMAVTDLQGLEELQREFGAFKRVFEEKSGMVLDFFPVNDRAAAAAALSSGQVDLVFTGPAEYVVINNKTQAQPVVSINRPGYHSCIYTKAGSGVNALSDLKGKKVAMSDVGSTSGHLGPSQMLKDAGLDPLKDVQVLTVGDTVHQALVRGDVAAVGVGCHDYAEYTAEGDRAKDFPIIKEGEPLPPDVIMARKDLDPATVDKVRQTFSQNWGALLPAMLEGKDNAKYKDATLTQTTDADYNRVREMYRAVGVNDFSEFLGD